MSPYNILCLTKSNLGNISRIKKKSSKDWKLKIENLNLYYWREYNKEVDFVIQNRDKVESLIQVTYELTPDNHNREIGALLKSSSELDCSNLQIVTWDDDRELEIEGKKIKIIPLWRWFLFELI